MRFWKRVKRVARFDVPIEQRMDIEDEELISMMIDPRFSLKENFNRLGLEPLPAQFWVQEK
jgi:hypothetical protein